MSRSLRKGYASLHQRYRDSMFFYKAYNIVNKLALCEALSIEAKAYQKSQHIKASEIQTSTAFPTPFEILPSTAASPATEKWVQPTATAQEIS